MGEGQGGVTLHELDVLRTNFKEVGVPLERHCPLLLVGSVPVYHLSLREAGCHIRPVECKQSRGVMSLHSLLWDAFLWWFDVKQDNQAV